MNHETKITSASPTGLKLLQASRSLGKYPAPVAGIVLFVLGCGLVYGAKPIKDKVSPPKKPQIIMS